MSNLPLFVEIMGASGQVNERVKITQLPATIGRAYDNDIIVDDPFMNAHHAQIERNQLDEIILSDLDSANGIYVKDRRVDVGIITGNETFSLGRTQVRLRPINFTVAPEKINAASYRYRLWPLAILFLILIAAKDLFTQWLYTSEPGDLTTYISASISTPAAVLVIAGLMAIIGKLFYGQARFILQLTIAGGFTLLSELLALFGHLVSFSLNLPNFILVTNGLAAAVSALAFYFHLRAMGATRKWLIGSIAAGLMIIILAFIATKNYQNSRYLTSKIYMGHVLPESFRLAGEKTPETFIEHSQKLQPKVDAQRKPKEQD